MAARAQWYLVSGIIIVLAGLLGAGLAFSPDLFLIAAGSEAPDFTATRVTDGATVTLDEYRGDVLIINIWATWCLPCEQEMPSFERLHQQLGPEGLKIVAVSVDAGDSDNVLEWIRERNITFEVLHDPTGLIERDYQITGWPESFIVDRQGIITKKVIGALEWDHENQIASIRRLLSANE